MNKKQQDYVEAIEMAIKALDNAFLRANEAEMVRPLRPLSHLWSLPETEREQAEREEIASYDVVPDHWGPRLALLSAFEALHAALRISASKSAPTNPRSRAWREAALRSREAARLALETAAVFEQVGLAAAAQSPRAGLIRNDSAIGDSDIFKR